ncbi:MAG: 50S ribosomal protein L32 [Clostridia bacterium]|jgi:large subunit ribosomal protein L32|nr:50S ribosomal protein L32 [Clostridia bacterium]
MAVPKGKVSKARKHKRNSANFKAAATTLVECPNCKEFKEPHKVCPKCGFYKGKQIVETEKKQKEQA